MTDTDQTQAAIFDFATWETKQREEDRHANELLAEKKTVLFNMLAKAGIDASGPNPGWGAPSPSIATSFRSRLSAVAEAAEAICTPDYASANFQALLVNASGPKRTS